MSALIFVKPPARGHCDHLQGRKPRMKQEDTVWSDYLSFRPRDLSVGVGLFDVSRPGYSVILARSLPVPDDRWAHGRSQSNWARVSDVENNSMEMTVAWLLMTG